MAFNISNKFTGDQGEREICEKIKCPNCGKQLVLLPPGFPMYDVQCSRCMFRAQIKTVNTKPKNSIFGAGWDIYEKVSKAGYLSPSLFVYFKWKFQDTICYEIRYYPFIPKTALKPYALSQTARRANYKMFKYVHLDKLPYFVLDAWYVEKGNVGKVKAINISESVNIFYPRK